MVDGENDIHNDNSDDNYTSSDRHHSIILNKKFSVNGIKSHWLIKINREKYIKGSIPIYSIYILHNKLNNTILILVIFLS